LLGEGLGSMKIKVPPQFYSYPQGYRQVEGIVRALSRRMVEHRGRTPKYTTVWERENILKML